MHSCFKVLGVLALALPVAADVTVIRSIESDGFMGMGGGVKEQTTWIAGNKHREEKRGAGKPSMMEKMAGMDRPEITRLDKKVKWTLNTPKKTYEEFSFVMPTANDSKDESSRSNEGSSGGQDEKPTMKVTKAEFSVKPLGQKKTINNFACENYEMTALLETEDLGTHDKNEMKMVTTLWTTPETSAMAALKKEEEAYAKAYREMFGFDAAAQASLSMLGGSMVAAMAGAKEDEMAKALSKAPQEMKKIKGYPVVTKVEWYGSENGKDKGASMDEAVDDEALESMKNMGGMFGEMAANMAKKKSDKKASGKSGPSPMFSMTTEIKSISTAAIPAATFEIPSGFKKASN